MKKKRTLSPRLSARQFSFLCASILAAVLAHVRHLPLAIAISTLALIALRWVQRQRTGGPIAAWVKLPLIAAFPAYIVLVDGNLFGREPGSALACAMITLKLLETETRRDAHMAISFASFVLMSALLFDNSMSFTLLLFAALGLFLATMQQLEPQSPHAAAVGWRRSAALAARHAGFALLAAVPLALVAFVFFPRLASPLWQTASDEVARTGISDSMSPGSIQNLLIDDSPAFRVSFEGSRPARQQLYWRGPVLTDFDGATWTRHDASLYRDDGAMRVTGPTVSYEVTLEANDKPWLFALDLPIDEPADAHRFGDMTLVRRRPVTDLLRYQVHSALTYRLNTTLSNDQRKAALSLPKDFNPKSIQLAESWRRDLHNDDAIVQAAMNLFHQSFFYTLAPPPVGRDSIDDFLFTNRRGFCEHFASGFVVLMRAAHIPARVVTGYQGGYFNNVGDYLLLRQSDAHAWAEVWLEGRGWVRMDPTAAVSPERVELGAQAAAGASSAWYQVGWILGVRNQFDLINRGWNSLIVQFNSLRQQSLLTPFGISNADYATLTGVLIGISTALLCVATFWVMRTPRRKVDPLDAAYDRLCRKIARAGFVRDPAEGPDTYSKRLQDSGELSGLSVRQAQALLAHYVSLRYACAFPDEAAIAAFSHAVRRLRAETASRSSADGVGLNGV